MMSIKDDWMRAAMADDKVVVELLVRLKQAHAVAPVKDVLFPPTKWGVRQPRSRMAMRFDAFTLQKDAAESTRNSPTTPLSWNASAASLSCTADGFEESTFRCAFTARSKSKCINNSSNDFTNNSSIKRRRKKTFAQLKDEETFLLKQKMYLKKEIENMQATYKEQRARNQSLKKMKVDLNNNNYRDGTHDDKFVCFASTLNKASPPLSDSQTLSDPYQEPHHEASSRSNDNVSFLLPDLNMEPCEEDSPRFQVF